MDSRTYEELLAEVGRLQAEDRLPRRPTYEQRLDWAYGQTKIDNDDVTRDDAERGVAFNGGR